jgi:hypothetical protein
VGVVKAVYVDGNIIGGTGPEKIDWPGLVVVTALKIYTSEPAKEEGESEGARREAVQE